MVLFSIHSFLLLLLVVNCQEQRLAIEAARRVDLLGRQGRHSEAVDAFGGGEGLPRSLASIAWHNHGLSLTELGRHDEAAAAFGTCLEYVEDERREHDVQMKLGDALAKSGDWVKASEAYIRASKLEDSSGLAAANAGAALLNIGDAKEALRHLERARESGRDEFAHLALARAEIGDIDGALDAIAHVDESSLEFAAMLLDKHVDLAVHALERVVDKDSSTYYRLSRLFSRIGEGSRAAEIRKRAVDENVWVDEWQQPAYFVVEPSISPPAPWIDPSQSSLASLAKTIENEVYPVAAAASTFGNYSFDDENIAIEKTSWTQRVLASNGQWIDGGELSLLLKSVLGRWFEKLPKGSIMISVLKPGAELVPHCGPSNHRLRIHLVLRGSENSTLTVGDPADPRSTRSHFPDGKILVFDDSYLHSATNRGLSDRVVLLIDVWHPALDDERSRDRVREHFSRT